MSAVGIPALQGGEDVNAIAVHHGSYGYAAFVFSLMVGGYLNALEKGK
jgi:hypothetical protein